MAESSGPRGTKLDDAAAGAALGVGPGLIDLWAKLGIAFYQAPDGSIEHWSGGRLVSRTLAERTDDGMAQQVVYDRAGNEDTRLLVPPPAGPAGPR